MESTTVLHASPTIQVRKEGIVLEKNRPGFDDAGVLNPAVIADKAGIHVFYRAVKSGNRSSIAYARLKSPLEVEVRDIPVLEPEFDYEKQGVEDPRIVLIEGKYYMTYTAYDGTNALAALAVSTDLKNFEKLGIVAPKVGFREFRKLVKNQMLNRKYFRFDQSSEILWDKNAMFFPRKINGKFAMLHRIRPGIQIVYFDSVTDLTTEFWQQYFKDFSSFIVLEPKCEHEISYIGGGCPPIETSAGWLLIYHSVRDTVSGYIYSACAALLDIEYPTREIARLPYPLFEPSLDYELSGEVDSVCFPTGTYVSNGRIYIYYGAADERIACASVNMQELIDELKNLRIS